MPKDRRSLSSRERPNRTLAPEPRRTLAPEPRPTARWLRSPDFPALCAAGGPSAECRLVRPALGQDMAEALTGAEHGSGLTMPRIAAADVTIRGTTVDDLA